MELVQPSVRFKDSYCEAARELEAEGRKAHFDIGRPDEEFATFVKRLHERSLGKHLKPGYVPETMFWLVDGDTFLGQVRIRHVLNEHLLRIGGHIGYYIRPSMRHRGYGTEILRLALPKAQELGINRALLTCDETNIGSRKIIEKNGGVLENKVSNPDGGSDKLRFWIEI